VGAAHREQTKASAAFAKVIPLQGGVPIKVGEETIGGVGLSGAPNGGRRKRRAARPASPKWRIS
jgi:uncharacterized protein GlcG (DUF336 family)